MRGISAAVKPGTYEFVLLQKAAIHPEHRGTEHRAAAVKGLGLKPYQYTPMAFVVANASGKESKAAALAVEFEARDVETNQVVAAGVRKGTGVELKSADEKLTLDHFKPLIDVWVKDVRATVEAGKLVRRLR